MTTLMFRPIADQVEKRAIQALALPDNEGLIGPVPVSGGGRMPEPVLDVLSKIIKSFNDQFGALFKDGDRVARRVTDEIAPKVAADPAYQNAKRNTPQTARIAHENALAKVMLDVRKTTPRSTSSSCRTRRSSGL